MNALFLKFDAATRVWIYRVVVVAFPLLVAWGKVAESDVQLYLAFISALLGIGTAAVNAPTQEAAQEFKNAAVNEYVEAQLARDVDALVNVPEVAPPAGVEPYEGD